jgi:hypothetical protein
MTRSDTRGHRPLAAVADNWVSRGYLLVFAALLVWVVLDTLLASHPDASFAGVWPFMWTLPTSMLLWLVPGVDDWLLLVGLSVAALVNATLLGLLVRALTPAHPRAHGTAR